MKMSNSNTTVLTAIIDREDEYNFSSFNDIKRRLRMDHHELSAALTELLSDNLIMYPGTGGYLVTDKGRKQAR